MNRSSTIYSIAIAAFSVSIANAQYSAWVDMAGTDTSSSMSHVSCCDGNTQGSNVGGLNCRKNVNTSSDLYMYFAVADSYAFNGNRPDLWITIHYYDNGTGALTLQYDATSSAYKTAGNVTLTNTNTWKAFGWHVTDAYFGNRENGNADFRVNRSTTGNFYMDLVYVREFCSGAPCVSMVTPPGFSNGNQAFRDLFEQSGQWVTARSKIDEMGSFDHRVNVFSDSELASWLPQITGWGKRFSIETGVVKDWCTTGQACFNAEKPTYDRFQNLGGTLNVMTMDEPLTAVRAFGLGSDQYAWEQTAHWMQLVRGSYPNTRIISIEAYPYINQTSLQNWITNLNNRCAVIGIQGMDGFMLDADWRNFPGNGSWPGVKALENYCHNRGVPFINTYWASPHSTSTNNCDWNNDIMTEGTAYQNAGGTPAEFNIESWLVIPSVCVPDNGTCTFTRSVVDFCNSFVPGGSGGGGGQAPYGGTPRNIPGTIQAEDYDTGGENVAYHDLTGGNSGGAYRSDGVDIEGTSDTGGGYNVGFIDTGEWLEYTVNVTNTGDHTFKLRVASPNGGGTITLKMNGNTIASGKVFTTTGGWQTWTTLLVPAVFLSAGNNQVLQVLVDVGGWNFNKIDVGYGGADAVHVDLASTVLEDGMTHPLPGDGDTTGATIGGHNCRRNVNSAEDFYMYFAVFDSYAFQGNRPNLWVSMDYYDSGSGTLWLQYDATSSPYKLGPQVTLTNSNTWKSINWNITDAYFGNRENNGADFRIFRGTGITFYLDTVQVSLASP